MVPTDSADDPAPHEGEPPAEAGRERPTAGTLDEGALYVVIRKAVEDAILGAIGTLLLVGLALVLVWVGAAMAISSGTRSGVLPAVVGVAIVLVGLYVAAATLEVIPPIREWF